MAPPETATWDTSAITAEEVAAVRRFLERRPEIEAGARAELARTFATRLWPKVAGAREGLDAEDFLTLLVAAKTARGAATRWIARSLSAGRERGSADVRALVPAHGRKRARPGPGCRLLAPLRGLVPGRDHPGRGRSTPRSDPAVFDRNGVNGCLTLYRRRLLHLLRRNAPGRPWARRRSGSGSSTSAQAARSASAAASSARSAGSSLGSPSARLLLDAVGQGEADLARQVRDSVVVPGPRTRLLGD